MILTYKNDEIQTFKKETFQELFNFEYINNAISLNLAGILKDRKMYDISTFKF